MRYWATVISLALDLDLHLHLHPRLNAASVAQPYRHKAFETTVPDGGPITTSNDLPCTSVLSPPPSPLFGWHQPCRRSSSLLYRLLYIVIVVLC